MRAALKTFVIGATLVSVGGLGPLSSAAHAVGAPRALHQQAGNTSNTTAGQVRTHALIARAPAAPTCQASQLAAAQGLSSGATGHIGIELRFRNVSAHPCTLKGYTTIVLLDGARRPLLTVLHWGPGGFFNNFNRPVRLVTLAPGGYAYLAVGWTHIPSPGQTCPLAPNLLILPPGASSALLLAVGHSAPPAYGPIDACGGQLAVSPIEPTPFNL
jgi:hypothetical protein